MSERENEKTNPTARARGERERRDTSVAKDGRLLSRPRCSWRPEQRPDPARTRSRRKVPFVFDGAPREREKKEREKINARFLFLRALRRRRRKRRRRLPRFCRVLSASSSSSSSFSAAAKAPAFSRRRRHDVTSTAHQRRKRERKREGNKKKRLSCPSSRGVDMYKDRARVFGPLLLLFRFRVSCFFWRLLRSKWVVEQQQHVSCFVVALWYIVVRCYF